MERARWMAFLILRAEVETFSAHEDDLRLLDPPVGLDDWLQMDQKVRDMRVDFAKVLRQEKNARGAGA